MKKKLISLVLALAAILALTACSKGKNSIWDKASPGSSVLELYVFDGESGWQGRISDFKEETAVLDTLMANNAKAVTDWTQEKITFPVYGVWIGTEDGNGVLAAWSNGYLILRDGSVNLFDCDFDAIEKEYKWGHKQEIPSLSEMPCGRYLVQNGDSWLTEFMKEVPEPSSPEGVSMEITDISGGKITVEFINSGDEEWVFGEYYSLEILAGGRWYAVPALPTENWSFTDIGNILEAGKAREKTYNLSMYGDLPPGTYRIAANGLTAEFNLED